jgi:hypothetical protein
VTVTIRTTPEEAYQLLRQHLADPRVIRVAPLSLKPVLRTALGSGIALTNRETCQVFGLITDIIRLEVPVAKPDTLALLSLLSGTKPLWVRELIGRSTESIQQALDANLPGDAAEALCELLELDREHQSTGELKLMDEVAALLTVEQRFDFCHLVLRAVREDGHKPSAQAEGFLLVEILDFCAMPSPPAGRDPIKLKALFKEHLG